MPMDYKQYQDEITSDITGVIADAGCQPILFVGSGFAKRYTQAPNWEELLRKLAETCPNIDKDYAYYKQTYNDLTVIGKVFADAYREWAWGEGRSKFPEAYFSEKYPTDIFLKHTVAELLKGLGPNEVGSFGSQELDAEIAALKAMCPHALNCVSLKTRKKLSMSYLDLDKYLNFFKLGFFKELLTIQLFRLKVIRGFFKKLKFLVNITACFSS